MSYVDDVLAKVEKKDSHEPEFLQTVREVLESLRPLIEKNEDGTETVQEIFAFSRFGVVGQHRKREASADVVRRIVVSCKNDGAFTAVGGKQRGDHIHFGTAGAGDPPLGEIGLKRLFAAFVPRGSDQKIRPAAGSGRIYLPPAEK